jgi:hypothetical protein
VKRRKPTTAAIEALQEVCALGKQKKKLGSYHYQKHPKNSAAIMRQVDVFPLAGHSSAQELVGNGAPPGLFRQPLARGRRKANDSGVA